MTERRVAFGIAGWSYDDWKGTVYPRGCRDPLAFCAGFVDCIEVNSTFYALPHADRAESWLRRTRERGTWFTAKLPQEFTHRGRIDEATVVETREGFGPLAASGRLRALLAQFNFRFVDGAAQRTHLARLIDAFTDLAPVVVELRHRSWQEDDALRWLGDLDVSVAHLDYPGAESGFGMRLTGLHGSSDLAYLRLHGRNAQAWFSKEAGRDQVYDYLYQPGEVDGLLARLTEIAAGARHTVVIGNNHFRGQELKVALEMAAAWHGEKLEVPPLLIETYPELARIAKNHARGLFG